MFGLISESIVFKILISRCFFFLSRLKSFFPRKNPLCFFGLFFLIEYYNSTINLLLFLQIKFNPPLPSCIVPSEITHTYVFVYLCNQYNRQSYHNLANRFNSYLISTHMSYIHQYQNLQNSDTHHTRIQYQSSMASSKSIFRVYYGFLEASFKDCL